MPPLDPDIAVVVITRHDVHAERSTQLCELVERRLEHRLALRYVPRDRDDVGTFPHGHAYGPRDQPPRCVTAGMQVRQQSDAEAFERRRQMGEVHGRARALQPARLDEDGVGGRCCGSARRGHCDVSEFHVHSHPQVQSLRHYSPPRT